MKLFILFLSMFPIGLMAQVKKTVCSITINSSEEINQFQKHLDPKLWNFLELTSSEVNWFEQSCASKVQCDILVVSGHFGGGFFGEKGFQLSMENLESFSCKKACDGIIKRPKEVFLFGCNTLSGKEQDQRTPEEYRRVLLEDGFSIEQANSVVAFRYSNYGDTFAGRMSQVFSNTPRIYGFTSIAPSGKNVEHMLDAYFRNYGTMYKDFNDMNSKLQAAKNDGLLYSLRSTAITQVEGQQIEHQDHTSETPYCYLANEKVGSENKLNYIKGALESPRALTFIPHIEKYVKEVVAHELTSNEQQIIKEISENPKIENNFNQLLKLEGDVFLPVRVKSFKLMRDLQIISKSEFSRDIKKIINLKLGEPISTNITDQICSADVEFDLNERVNDLRADHWSNSAWYILLACIKPQNPDIAEKTATELIHNESPQIRKYAALALGKMKPNNPVVDQALARSIMTERESYVRTFSVRALGESKTTDQSILDSLSYALLKDVSSDVRRNVADTLRIKKNQNPQLHKALLTALLDNSNKSSIQWNAGLALSEIKSTVPEIQQGMIQAALMTHDWNLAPILIRAIGTMEIHDLGTLQSLAEMYISPNLTYENLLSVTEESLLKLSTLPNNRAALIRIFKSLPKEKIRLDGKSRIVKILKGLDSQG